MGGDHIARYARHLFVWEDGTRLLDQTQTVVNFSGNSLKLAFKGFAILCCIPSLTHVKISKRKKNLMFMFTYIWGFVYLSNSCFNVTAKLVNQSLFIKMNKTIKYVHCNTNCWRIAAVVVNSGALNVRENEQTKREPNERRKNKFNCYLEKFLDKFNSFLREGKK